MGDGRRPRVILHLDMDAFYPSVEVLDDPSLRGKPVIVGGGRERGVVSSASYEARAFGVRSALPVAAALRLCPHGVFLPVRMSRYREVSGQVFEVFHRFTSRVEALSIDEAFLDVTGSQRLFGPPEEIAVKVKQAVFSRVGITVSAGVAPNKFTAKIASDLQKPDGLTVVPEGGVQAFLNPLPIEKLWGVGEATRKRLALLGVRTIGDLSRVPLRTLEARFGKHGTHLHLLSRGIDDREVATERAVKSVGHEDTYPRDILDPEALRRELLSLCMRVTRRLRGVSLKGRTVTLKVKYADFRQTTRSRTLEAATDDGAEIFRHACRLLEKTDAGRKPVRLLGIALSGLDPLGTCRQPGLFEREPPGRRRNSLNRALDRIHGRFGEGAVLPGTLVEKENPEK